MIMLQLKFPLLHSRKESKGLVSDINITSWSPDLSVKHTLKQNQSAPYSLWKWLSRNEKSFVRFCVFSTRLIHFHVAYIKRYSLILNFFGRGHILWIACSQHTRKRAIAVPSVSSRDVIKTKSWLRPRLFFPRPPPPPPEK